MTMIVKLAKSYVVDTHGHVLYCTGDPDLFEDKYGRWPSICDRNGEVCLAMCRRCGLAENELTGVTCSGKNDIKPPMHPDGERLFVAHDRFEGDVIGRYKARDGKTGVVLQQINTKVVHVYGDKWFEPAPVAIPVVQPLRLPDRQNAFTPAPRGEDGMPIVQPPIVQPPPFGGKKIVGELEQAAIAGSIVYGTIYGDTRGRFKDGDNVHTSTIMPDTKTGDDYVVTLNSVYRVRSWAGLD